MNSYQDLLVNTVTVLSTAESTSSTTGSVIVKGGVGIKGNLYVDGNLICNNSSNNSCNNSCNNSSNNSCNNSCNNSSNNSCNNSSNNSCNNSSNNSCNNSSNNLDLTSVNSDILPCTSNIYCIGNNCKIWKNIYLDCINVNSFEKDLIPKTDCILNIGSNCYKWKNLYLSENGNIPCLLTSTIKALNNCNIDIDNNVNINGNLVVNGTITSNENNENNCNENDCNENNCLSNNCNEINYDLIPSCTNTFSIGSCSNKWKNIYLSEEFHLGINNDFVHMNSCDKHITINGSGNNNSLYGNIMELNYTGCLSKNANLLKLNHNSNNLHGTKILFQMDNISSCNIGVNYVNSKHTYIIAPSDGNTCVNTVMINSCETNINTNVNIEKSINIGNNIKYNNNLIHSYELANINNCTVDTTTTFSEFTIDQEYKEINFIYDPCNLQVGQIKHFIVTENNVDNTQCESTPHYKICINDLINGSAIILSSVGQTVGLIWTTKNKWLCFSGITCIIV
jgi:hypothetical protein